MAVGVGPTYIPVATVPTDSFAESGGNWPCFEGFHCSGLRSLTVPPACPRSQHTGLAIAGVQGFWSEEGKCVREHAWQALLLVQPQFLTPSRPNTE